MPWSRIEHLLARNAPACHARLNPPADPAVLREAEQEIGRPLPDGLAAWWRAADGVSPARPTLGETPFRLFPYGCDPYPVEDALRRRKEYLCSMRDTVPPPLADALEVWLARCGQDRAGTYYPHDVTPLWLPQWLPVGGDAMGGGLFVDLRAGDQYGCVVRHGTTSHGPEPSWPNIETLLAHVADTLEELGGDGD
ncbi:SMI1/KNR4 family protein [Streptomyces rhizosphaerihabitans]|uniref:SMI1/KNR4 family protein n=1 Tax=Streptomyces rhizosphaerihabitans TaxID=1266770 RepID=UPI0021BFA5AC|nr:SMI1/KNR4 family protein [Streptomyces rhizosphaerihabitans]MCT9007333.1 SMI1/KNR4 family protein [Streptomyces rhizosphaerihabitans]